MSSRGRRQLRHRFAAVLRDLELPASFDVPALCAALGKRRGRPIRLLPLPGLSEVCGLWIATDTTDLIAYESNTSAPHQDHIVLHEIGHMLCDHYPATLTPAEQMRLLLPSLDPAMVRRVLGRAGYSSVEEREAEFFATMLGQHTGLSHRGDSVADKLRSALEDGSDRG
ncbi:hypothetical protein Amsp01_058450 [Amycolatopsis sp. NBRC 101858]|uniref:hypothetical protein n=1 Tax=Amycolatopsis sp. NBRC 101858 TaxID=3032200 RepID=UPI0024A24759|nr:hypothetical protein [Amycolatopsis sp. NBRC 101858]GLY39822.1 hypothetical protein Amsp01_058450 [Amycolatopsis sp. NBRC 101858]